MITRRISFALATAGFILALAAGLAYAQDAGLIGGEAAKRITQVVIGLVLAVYGNFMPKDVAPARASARDAARMQSALRVGGWAMTLAGLSHAAVWAMAPIAIANVAAAALVATATITTMAYGGWCALGCRIGTNTSA